MVANDFSFNVSKGRAVEFYNRVKSNDPANSALVVVLLAAAGLETDAVLKDKDTLADVVSGTTNEATNTGYARKILTDADLAALPPPDDVLDERRLPLPNQTWLAVLADGTGNIGKLLVCYDPDITAGTDADIIPVSGHGFPVTVDGNDIVTNVAATGFYRAAETCP
jgi:hypothetical protein